MPKVDIQEIMEAIDFTSYEHSSYLNRETGKVEILQEYFLRKAENDEDFTDLPDWQQDQMKLAIDLLENEEKYLKLPEQFEANEYRMMEDFCFTLDTNKQQVLLQEIEGKGAFRRFKDKIIDLNVDDEWYEFREKAYRQFAIRFCKARDVEYEA
mgnify:CR=1 FL=1